MATINKEKGEKGTRKRESVRERKEERRKQTENYESGKKQRKMKN